MSQEQVIKFFDFVAQNEAVQGALNYYLSTISPETVLKIAQENSFNFSNDDLKAVLENQSELSSEQLDAVAGGQKDLYVKGSPVWVQNQPFRSKMQESLQREAVESGTEEQSSAADILLSLKNQ